MGNEGEPRQHAWKWLGLVLLFWIPSAAFAEEAEAPLTATPTPPEAERRVWTLDEVLERARERAITGRIAASREQEAAWQRREATALRLPRAEGTLGLAPAPRIDEDDFDRSDLELLARLFDGFGPAFRGELNVGMPLLTFGKIRLAVQLGDLGVDAARLESQRVELETLFQSFRAYAVLQWYAHVRALLQEAESRLDEAEDVLEDRLDDGDRTARTELRRLTILRATLVRTRADARQADRTARYGLALALALPEDLEVETWEDHAQTVSLPSWEVVERLAREHRPEIELLDVAVRARELQAALEWRRLTPDVLLLANVGGAWSPTIPNQSGPFVYDPYNRFGMGIALGARWSFDYFTRRASAQRMEARAETMRLERDAAWIALRLSIRQAWEEAEAAAEVLESAEAALRAARAWLNQTAFQFEQGFASFEDLSDPLGTYYDVAGRYWEAALAYRLRVANLALQVGVAPNAWSALVEAHVVRDNAGE